ncbi:MAG: modification methylase [Flaviaesturariibacter sp.]|nr:modification methylase [Flaviaesturariibacter sp.]
MKKSPLRYPGGKSRGMKFLKDFLPPFNELREVFFGGGSFSFYCLQQLPGKTYKASDLNYELYCFWTQLRNNTEALVQGVQAIYDGYDAGKQLFIEIVARRNNELSELERAIDFYVLNRITFSGVVDAGGYSEASFEGRFTQSSIDRLWETAPLIQPIQFFCEDYSFLINEPGQDVLLFLDPPYYSATKSKLYGKKGILHTGFDHALLFQTLQASAHQWLVTYDNCAYIKNLYKDFYQVEWELQYGMTNSGNNASVLGKELLIANYDIASRIRNH